jgi:hypothetical protein
MILDHFKKIIQGLQNVPYHILTILFQSPSADNFRQSRQNRQNYKMSFKNEISTWNIVGTFGVPPYAFDPKSCQVTHFTEDFDVFSTNTIFFF